MKCIDCILFGTERKAVHDSTVVQDAVDNAEQAITIWKGDALCANHVLRRLVAKIGEALNESVPRT